MRNGNGRERASREVGGRWCRNAVTITILLTRVISRQRQRQGRRDCDRGRRRRRDMKHPSGGDTMWSVRSSRVYPRTVCANVCSAFRWCTLLTSKFYPLFKGRRVRDFPGIILIECSHAILMEETTANDAMAYRSPPRPHVVITALSAAVACTDAAAATTRPNIHTACARDPPPLARALPLAGLFAAPASVSLSVSSSPPAVRGTW